MDSRNLERRKISISQDGVWAGDGYVVDGRIEDCAAMLGRPGLRHDNGDQQDEAEQVYQAIEEAIEEGELMLDGIRYTWSLEEPRTAEREV